MWTSTWMGTGVGRRHAHMGMGMGVSPRVRLVGEDALLDDAQLHERADDAHLAREHRPVDQQMDRHPELVRVAVDSRLARRDLRVDLPECLDLVGPPATRVEGRVAETLQPLVDEAESLKARTESAISRLDKAAVEAECYLRLYRTESRTLPARLAAAKARCRALDEREAELQREYADLLAARGSA